MKHLRLLLLALAVSSSALAGQPSDPVETRYRADLSKLKSDYDQKLKAIYGNMIRDYEREVSSALASRDSAKAELMKSKLETLRDKINPELKIVGKWNITQSNNVSAVWTFNRDKTYNYWNETGEWKYSNGKYLLTHTWDWEIKMTDENTFEGTCTRGATCTIRGLRAPE
jgi:hypothetical protein